MHALAATAPADYNTSPWTLAHLLTAAVGMTMQIYMTASLTE